MFVNIKVIKIYIRLRIKVALKKHVSQRFFPTPKVKKKMHMQGTCNKTQKNIIKQQVPSEDLVGARQRIY